MQSVGLRTLLSDLVAFCAALEAVSNPLENGSFSNSDDYTSSGSRLNDAQNPLTGDI